MTYYDDAKREFLLAFFIDYYGGTDKFAASFYAEQVELFVDVCDAYPFAHIGAEFADTTILAIETWARTRCAEVAMLLTRPATLNDRLSR